MAMQTPHTVVKLSRDFIDLISYRPYAPDERPSCGLAPVSVYRPHAQHDLCSVRLRAREMAQPKNTCWSFTWAMASNGRITQIPQSQVRRGMVQKTYLLSKVSSSLSLGSGAPQVGQGLPAGNMNQIPVVAASAACLRNLRKSLMTRRSNASLSLVVGRERRETNDGDLARGLIAGESWAIAETWHRFAPMVMMMAERCLGSSAEAKDIGQEVFYRVFRKAKTLRDPNCLRSFIYSFAIRALRTELRRKKLGSWLSLDQPEAVVDAGGETLDVESRDLLRRFHVLLDRLSPRDRLVFVLRRMESMTVEEISSHMNISESTVKRSMAQASSRLSRWIDADPALAGLFEKGRWGR